MVLCGISRCFHLLSPCLGQIVHALLTRPPLTLNRSSPSARLACVKHAASVRPEPGSNSDVQSFTCFLSSILPLAKASGLSSEPSVYSLRNLTVLFPFLSVSFSSFARQRLSVLRSLAATLVSIAKDGSFVNTFLQLFSTFFAQQDIVV